MAYKETYFVISNSDGDTNVEAVEKQKLLERLAEGYYGKDRRILTELPNNSDTNYWDGDLLIIKGKMVVPIEKKVVTEFEIE